MPAPFDLSLASFLQERISGPLPGRKAQRRYSHQQSYGRHFGPAFRQARRAAVLILIRWDGTQWLLPLMRRQPGGVHSGQICFPGGGLESGETEIEAAIREYREETGWAPQRTEIIGQLSPLYVYGSDNFVSCIVAMTQDSPDWDPDEREVAELLEVPLEHLCNDPKMHETTIGRIGLQTSAPCFRWKDYDIWGATSMMISELKTLILT